MKEVTQYEADDGTVWNTTGEASKRDTLLADIDKAMSPMGERYHDVDSGRGWWQHRPEDVLRAKQQFLELCQARGFTHPAFFAPVDRVHSGSIVGRVLSDTGGPLNSAWYRFACTDNSGREYEQPYFAKFGPDAHQTCLNLEP